MKYVEHDGFFIDEAGRHAIRKYELIEYYAGMFTKSMKRKWSRRIYLDMFASSGYAQIKGTKNIVETSPLIALNTMDKFTDYIFCEICEEKMNSLKERVSREYSTANVEFILGDVNENINKIENLLEYSEDNTALTFCLVDPYNIDNLSFNSIRSLANYKIDFLILLPSFMDVNRNENHYIKEESKSVENFVGVSGWREIWLSQKSNGLSFGTFIAKMFNNRMVNEGFISLEDDEYVLIKLDSNQTPLYHLSFFSKHKLGKEFWRKSIKGTTDQEELF